MRQINEIIVHCSATKPSQKVTVADITRWHQQRGWRTIGYHYVIYQDGSVHPGRKEAEVGAHVSGRNAKSLGVCYIGGLDDKTGKPKDTRTEAQKQSLLELLIALKHKYPTATIHGHNEFAAKACPCFDAKTEYKGL